MINGPIHLSREAGVPLYVQIADQLAAKIRAEAIGQGERLPSVRDLASQLGVNKVTVVNAYRQLVSYGLASQKIGSGTYVTSAGQLEAYRPQHEIPAGAIDLATATAPPDLFPMDLFHRSIDRVLSRDGQEALDYGEVQGYLPLRESLGSYVSRKGIRASAETVHVVSGAQQGLDLVAKAVLNPGDTAVVESPGYPGARACFMARGCHVLSLSRDEDQLDPSVLREFLNRAKPRLIYVNPDFHNPTGTSYSHACRRALLETATEQGILVLEDDFSSELRYEGEPLPSLASMEGGEQVIYMKSLSALTLPGMRLALMVVPPVLSAPITRAKYLADIASGGLIQRAFDLFIREGHWEGHLDLLLKECSRRYQQALERIRTALPQTRIHPPGGGLHLWLTLPRGLDADQLETRARDRGVCILAGSAFGGSSDHIRLSFSGSSESDFQAGIHILSRMMSESPPSRRPVV